MHKVLVFLNELSDRDVDWLIETGEKRAIPSGTVLINEGTPVDTLYIMLDGTLVVSIAAMGVRELARLYSGEVVGEMSFVDARPPSATVKTMEDSLVLAIPRPLLAQKLQDDESFGSRFYKALAILLSHRLRGTVKQLGYSTDDHDEPPTTNGQQVTVTADDDTAIAVSRFEHFLKRLEVTL
ncbi:MAG: cyclic nucleotide-binding domain-containing protein [Leptolyngbyaceae bacterium]|nr:cyclic nucleotide-binding domain-containing protein [Leptolyngbyaceae bacterium]